LGLLTPFVGSCWGHAMSKWCQYAINDSKECVNLPFFPIKEAQSIFGKTITWTKKSGKGSQAWHEACELTGVPPGKQKTPYENSICFKSCPMQKNS
jgi:hypothetical protein